MNREQMIATLELHGWRPAAAVKNMESTRETLVQRDTDKLGIRVPRGKKAAVVSRWGIRHSGRTREPRQWIQISSPRLAMIFTRFERLMREEIDDRSEVTP